MIKSFKLCKLVIIAGPHCSALGIVKTTFEKDIMPGDFDSSAFTFGARLKFEKYARIHTVSSHELLSTLFPSIDMKKRWVERKIQSSKETRGKFLKNGRSEECGK